MAEAVLDDVLARQVAPPPAVAIALAGVRPPFWSDACTHLRNVDGVLATVMARGGEGHLVPRGDPFMTLARSIVGQQISVKAAQAVWNRLEAAAGTMTPLAMLALDTDAMRACGLSYRKIEYLNDLAVHFDAGAIDPAHWDEVDDETIIEELTGVRGIGRWTAEMFLMFNLLRPDVFPLDDIGLLKALGVAYHDGTKVSRTRALEIGEAWRPWRSVATWYLWRSLDAIAVEY